MDKVAPGTAFLLKVAANIADLNRGQFMEDVLKRCVGKIQRSALGSFMNKEKNQDVNKYLDSHP